MRSKRIWMMGSFFFAAALLVLLLPPGARLHAKPAAAQSEEPVPAYHAQPPTEALPETMDPTQFDNPVIKNAYALAAKVKKVLYQQPCYCHCDQHEGHGSLLDCFVGNHTAGCGVCMKEAFYVYEQLHKGKKAAQIREGIMRGEWNQVDLKKYETPMPPK